MVQPLRKTACKFLEKLRIELSYDPTTPFGAIYVKEIKTLYLNIIIILLPSCSVMSDSF